MHSRSHKRIVTVLLTVFSLLVPAGSMLASAPSAHAVSSPTAGTLVTITEDHGVTAVTPTSPALNYTVTIGCGKTTGCGPATMTINLPRGTTLPKDATTGQWSPIAAPGMQSYQISSDGTTVTITWANFVTGKSDGGTFTFSAVLNPNAPLTDSGPIEAKVTLTAGGDTISDSASAVLTVPPKASVTSGTDDTKWTCSGAGCSDTSTLFVNQGGNTSYAVTATPALNTDGTLTFTNPGTTPAGSSIKASEAFDMTSLTFSSNPGGATVIFTDYTTGAQTPITVPAGVLSVTVPAGNTYVGYQVTFNNLNETSTSPITVTEGLKLRSTLRTTGGAVTAGAATAIATTAVTAAADTATSTVQSSKTIAVKVPDLKVSANKTWTNNGTGRPYTVTTSGDPSTIKVQVANTSGNDLTGMTIIEPNNTYLTSAFDYFQITGAPTITFPAGATKAHVTYFYGSGASSTWPTGNSGALSLTGPGTVAAPAVPAPHTWADVVQVEVDFDSPGDSITQCTDVAAACAGQLSIPTALRANQLSTGFAIGPTTSVTVSNQADVSVTAGLTGGGVTATLPNPAHMYITPPQYTTAGTKTLGAPEVNYSLTGATGAGDIFDPAPGATQHYYPHPLTFTVAANQSAGTNTDLRYGPKVFSIVDPSSLTPALPPVYDPLPLSKVPAATALPGNTGFFALAQVSSLAPPTVTCDVDADRTDATPGTPVPPSSVKVTGQALVAKSVATSVAPIAGPATWKDISTVSSADYPNIIGLAYQAAMVDGSAFSINTQCTITTNASVMWRLTNAVDGKDVAVNKTGSNPNALMNVNTADVRTDNPVSASSFGSAPYTMLLVTAPTSNGMKVYANAAPSPLSGAPAVWGIQGQGQLTSYQLAVAASDPGLTGVQTIDGSTDVSPAIPSASVPAGFIAGQSFDVFNLTGVRDAHLGPDQSMVITLYDKAGNILYVARAYSGALTGTSAANNEKPSSTDYTTRLTQAQVIYWYTTPSSTTYLGAVPTAADLANVTAVRVDLFRNTPGVALPEGASGRITLDVQLRDTFRSSGLPVVGKPVEDGGKQYDNVTRIFRTTDPVTATQVNYPNNTVTNPGSLNLTYADWASATFSVVSPGPIYNTARILWDSAGDSLVAANATQSVIRLGAYNLSAVGGACPGDQASPPTTDPASRWTCSGALAMGVSTLTASVGAPDAAKPNPFALVQFKAITAITWPVTITGGHADAWITYTYANGATEVKGPLAYNASLAGAQPTGTVGQIVGVSVTFNAGTDYITMRSTANSESMTSYNLNDDTTRQSGITFTTTLRSSLLTTGADPYPYTFDSFNPAKPGEQTIDVTSPAISGPSDNSKPQVAAAWVSADASVDGVAAPQLTADQGADVAKDTIRLLKPSGGVYSYKSNDPITAFTPMYRDQKGPNPSTEFTVTGGNWSAFPVDQITLNDSGCAVTAAALDNMAPSAAAGCTIVPGSMWDAFNLTGLRITRFPRTVPDGADTMDYTVWFLVGSTWYPNTTLGTWPGNLPWPYLPDSPEGAIRTVGLPASLIADHYTWSDVTGVRLSVFGHDVTQGTNNYGSGADDGIYNPSWKIANTDTSKVDPACTDDTVVIKPATCNAQAGNATMVLTMQLRDALRSSGEPLPNSGLDGNGEWTVPNTSTASTWMIGPDHTQTVVGAPLAKSANAVVLPGTPNPKAILQAGSSLSIAAIGTTGNPVGVYPGSIVHLLAGVYNDPAATGAAYNNVIVIPIPDGLVYDGSESAAPVAPTADNHVMPLSTSDYTCAPDSANPPTTVTCTINADIGVMPGDALLLSVPLRVKDGQTKGINVANIINDQAVVEQPTDPSRCYGAGTDPAAPANGNTQCTAMAILSPIPGPNARMEKYVGAASGGTISGPGSTAACTDTSVVQTWGGTQDFVENPCRSEAGPNDTITYRLKLINSGTFNLTTLRFVDSLPGVDDGNTIMPGVPRGSAFTPTFVPGSLTVLGSIADSADTDFYVGLTASSLAPRFTTSATPPCALDDAANGLSCTPASPAPSPWTSGAPTAAATAIGGEITFPADNLLKPGQYILVEFKMKIPASGPTVVSGAAAYNDATVVGSADSGATFTFGSSSTIAAVDITTTSFTITKKLTGTVPAVIGNSDQTFNFWYQCNPAGGGTPQIGGPVAVVVKANTLTATSDPVTDIATGSTCWITKEQWLPYSGSDTLYGTVTPTFATTPPTTAATAASDGYTAVFPAAIVPDGLTTLTVSNSLNLTSVQVSQKVDGPAASMIGASNFTFTESMACTFNGVAQNFGPWTLKDGESAGVVQNLPVGSSCVVTQTVDNKATKVTFKVGSATDAAAGGASGAWTSTALGTTSTVSQPIPIVVTDWYDAGQLKVTKNVTNTPGKSLGTVAITVACTFPGQTGSPVTLPTTTSSLSYAMGIETTHSWGPFDVPVGAYCTATETANGGSDSTPGVQGTPIAALPTVNQLTIANTLSAYSLTVTSAIAGSATTPTLQGWVPLAYEINVTCTRMLDGVKVYDLGSDTTPAKYTVTAAVGTPGTKTIDNLPNGTTCSVYESKVAYDPAAMYINTVGGVTGTSLNGGYLATTPATITLTGANGTVAITNTYSDGSIKVTHSVVKNGVEPWHIDSPNGAQFTMNYTCSTPTDIAAGTGPSIVSKAGTAYPPLVFGGASGVVKASPTAKVTPNTPDLTTAQTASITGIPVGTICQITSEAYVPSTALDPNGFYGTINFSPVSPAAAVAPVKKGYAASVSGPATAASALARTDGQIDIVTEFEPDPLYIDKTVSGAAAAFVNPNLTYDFTVTCTYNGVTEPLTNGTPSLTAGATPTLISATLTAGASCTITETTSHGATSSTVTLTADAGSGATVSAVTGATTTSGGTVTFSGGTSETNVIHWNNVFAPGSLEIIKTVTRPTLPNGNPADVGTFEFTIACTLADGTALYNPNFSPLTATTTDPTTLDRTIEGLPVGASCTVSETVTGGANDVVIPNPTVTIPPAAGGPVVVDMTNIFDPAELDLDVSAIGTAVDAGEPWVPTSWDFQVTCTRTIKVNGADTVVTDYDGIVTGVTIGTTTVVSPLPSGSTCVVSEPDSKGANAVTAVVGTGLTDKDGSTTDETATFDLLPATVSGTTRTAAMSEVMIVNEYLLAQVTVVEQVQGPAPAGVKLPFTATATYIDYQGATQTYTLPTSAFTLGAGGSLVVDAPLGSTITITQTDKKGAVTVYTLVAGTRTDSATFTQGELPEALTVTFVDIWAKIPAGGAPVGGMGLAGMLAALLIAVGGAVILIRRRTILER